MDRLARRALAILLILLAQGLPGTSFALPIIDLHKLVNGVESVTPPGPTLVVGSAVTFTYRVDNAGDESLTVTSLTDDNGTPGNVADDFAPAYVTGDVNANGKLDITEEWMYSWQGQPATLGLHQNTATVLGMAQTGVQTIDFATAYYTGALSVGVPEPATLALFGIALAGLGFSRRKRIANKNDFPCTA